jgi:hypothetical protein
MTTTNLWDAHTHASGGTVFACTATLWQTVPSQTSQTADTIPHVQRTSSTSNQNILAGTVGRPPTNVCEAKNGAKTHKKTFHMSSWRRRPDKLQAQTGNSFDMGVEVHLSGCG